MFSAQRSRRRRGAVAIVAAIVACLALAGCGSSANSPAGSAGATRTVVDNAGRSVRIPVNITRVATNLPALPPAIYLLGAMKRLVATTSVGVSTFLGKVDPAAKAIPTNAFPSFTTVNNEALLAARPQVVLTSNYQTALLPTYQRLGIPVLVFGASSQPNDPPALKAEMELLGQVFGGQALSRAHDWESAFQTNLATVAAKTSAIPQAKRPTVYYATSTPTTTDPTASWITEGGGRNLAAENGITQGRSFAFPTITTESLLKWNSQVIVTQQAAAAQKFQTQPQFASLAAVRAHQVHASPSGIWPWSTGLAEQPLEPLWMAKTLYPAQFTDVDLVQETKTFYTKFYDYQLTDQQAGAIVNASPLK